MVSLKKSVIIKKRKKIHKNKECLPKYSKTFIIPNIKKIEKALNKSRRKVSKSKSVQVEMQVTQIIFQQSPELPNQSLINRSSNHWINDNLFETMDNTHEELDTISLSSTEVSEANSHITITSDKSSTISKDINRKLSSSLILRTLDMGYLDSYEGLVTVEGTFNVSVSPSEHMIYEGTENIFMSQTQMVEQAEPQQELEEEQQQEQQQEQHQEQQPEQQSEQQAEQQPEQQPEEQLEEQQEEQLEEQQEEQQEDYEVQAQEQEEHEVQEQEQEEHIVDINGVIRGSDIILSLFNDGDFFDRVHGPQNQNVDIDRQAGGDGMFNNELQPLRVGLILRRLEDLTEDELNEMQIQIDNDSQDN